MASAKRANLAASIVAADPGVSPRGTACPKELFFRDRQRQGVPEDRPTAVPTDRRTIGRVRLGASGRLSLVVTWRAVLSVCQSLHISPKCLKIKHLID